MAALRVTAENTASHPLVAATAKTIAQINAPANQALIVRRIGVFFDGASPTAVPVTVLLVYKTTAGTGTAVVLGKINPADPETIQSTSTENHTIEGTNGVVADQWLIHPQQGIDITYAMGQEKLVRGGGRLALVLTAPAAVNVRGKIDFDE